MTERYLSADFSHEASSAASILHLLHRSTPSDLHHLVPVHYPMAPIAHLPTAQSDDCR